MNADTYPTAYEYEWSDNQAWTAEPTVDAAEFTDLITSVNGLVDEAMFRFTPDEVSVQVVDPAQVAMAEARRECVTDFDDILEVGLPLSYLPERLPGYWPGDEFTVTVSHGSQSDDATISHVAEGRYELEAYKPEHMRTPADWPSPDYNHGVTIDAPKVNGVLTAMAAAADSRVRITPIGDTIRFEANDEDGGWIYEWELEAWNVGVGDPQNYLTDISSGLAPLGEYEVRFGREQPFELETDGLRYILAPRVMNE